MIDYFYNFVDYLVKFCYCYTALYNKQNTYD